MVTRGWSSLETTYASRSGDCSVLNAGRQAMLLSREKRRSTSQFWSTAARSMIATGSPRPICFASAATVASSIGAPPAPNDAVGPR
jgi:hypothetical protein